MGEASERDYVSTPLTGEAPEDVEQMEKDGAPEESTEHEHSRLLCITYQSTHSGLMEFKTDSSGG
jgi:hypothetical protein